MRKYVALMRVKPWQKWPTGNTSRFWNWKDGRHSLKIHLTITCHDAASAGAGKSPDIWRYEAITKTEAMVGAKIIFTHGQPQEVSIRDWITNAFPGEIDICCVIESDDEIESLQSLADSMTLVVMANLGMVFNDTFVPMGLMRRGGLLGPSVPFDIEIRNRRTISSDDIQTALENALQPYKDGEFVWKHPKLLSTAVRRFMLGETRLHPVDRYLDYWLTCEVLTSQFGHKDEAPHSKIANSLAPHVGRSKNNVENALRLRDLKKCRDDIVHGRRDEIPGADVGLLRMVAEELLRKELRLQYIPENGCQSLETKLTAYVQEKTAAREAKRNKEKDNSKK